jgi:hypothetical protein
MKKKCVLLSGCVVLVSATMGLFHHSSHAGVLSLDGSTWVSLENDAGLIPVGDDPFTLEAWINPSGPTGGRAGGQITFWGNQSGNQSNGFRMRGPAGVRHYFWGIDHDEDFEDGDIIEDDTGPNEDGWHHLALTYDGAETVWYHNGAPLGIPREVSGVNVADTNFRIGSRLDAEFFDGFLDEIRIWNVARSEGDIAGAFETELNGGEEGLVAYFNFTADLSDATGNGHDGTDEGAAEVDIAMNAPVTPAGDNDTDDDGLLDLWEQENFGNLDQTADGDPDGDELKNGDELANRTDPNEADTDMDGLSDKVEVDGPTDPRDNDSDDDLLLDGVETNTGIFVSATDTGTDPLNPNTDGDGSSDGKEIADGTNPVDANDPPLPPAPKRIGVLALDGFTHLSFENESELIPDEDEPFTLEAWINPTSIPTDGGNGGQILFWGNQSGNQSNGFRLRGEAGVRHYFWGNDHDENFEDGSIIEDDTGPNEDGWHHLAFTFDGEETNWYHNGEPLGNPREVSGVNVADSNHRIGSRLDAEFFDGFLDEIAIWNVARSGEDIAESRDLCLDPGTPGLVALWNFNGTDDNFLDATGNGHDGTPEGDGATIDLTLNAPCLGGDGTPFQIIEIAYTPVGRSVALTWTSTANRIYSLEFSSDLKAWTEVDDGIESEGDETTFTDEGIPADVSERYYRVTQL